MRGRTGCSLLSFCVSGYRYGRGQAEPVVDYVFPFLSFAVPKKRQFLLSDPPEVAVGHPPLVLLRVSPSCPSPQRFENGRIDMDKGFFGRSMLVKVCPSPYFGVEESDQPVCRGLFVFLDDFSDVRQETFARFSSTGESEIVRCTYGHVVRESQIRPQCALSWFSLPRVPVLVPGGMP